MHSNSGKFSEAKALLHLLMKEVETLPLKSLNSGFLKFLMPLERCRLL